VLVLTASDSHNVYLSGRNLPDVHVMRFADASAYEICGRRRWWWRSARSMKGR